MPRFSDIFVYRSASNDMIFNHCHLLKKVGVHEAGTKIDHINFDVHGMVLFFMVNKDTTGPYVLTTPN